MRALVLIAAIATAAGHTGAPHCPEGSACPAGSWAAYPCDDGTISPAGSTRCCPADITCPAGTAVDGDACTCMHTACERPGDALVIAPRGAGLVCLPDIRACGPGMALEPRTGACMRASQVTCEGDGAMLWVKREPHPVLAGLSTPSFLCMLV